MYGIVQRLYLTNLKMKNVVQSLQQVQSEVLLNHEKLGRNHLNWVAVIQKKNCRGFNIWVQQIVIY